MADVRVASTGDAIPLLDPDGSSNYIVGRNNQSDIRASLMTLLGSANGSSFAVRPGVYARSYSAGTVGSLRVIQNGTADRNVQVQGGISLHTRGGTSPYLAYWPATTLIQASPANATNPRIDLVVARMYDKGAFPADPFHGPYIEIIEGTAAASPSAPSLPDGAVALAELARDAGSAGDTITTAKITDRRKSAHLPGTPRLLMAGDLAADTGFVPGEQRYRVVAGALLPMEYWGADSQWHGTVPVTYQTIGATASGSTTGSPVAISIPIADPGWPYYLEASGSLAWNQGVNTVYSPVVQLSTGTVVARGVSVGTNAVLPTGNNRASLISARRIPAAQTGAKTVQLVLQRDPSSTDGTSGVEVFSGGDFNYLYVRLIPA